MMIMQKLTTMVRGAVRESAEVVIDANAIRIFEQEIHETEMAIRKAKANLTVVVAEKIKLQRELERSQAEIDKREQQAVKALEQGEEELAADVAVVIAREETVRNSMQASLAQLQQQEQALTAQLRHSVETIKAYRRELELAKATARSQQAAQMLQGQHTRLGLGQVDLQESLERIKRQQQSVQDRLFAAEQVQCNLGEGSLDEKLKQKGLAEKDAAESVLERLRGCMGASS